MDVRIIGEAAEGNELLKMLKNKKADIVILDINMPGMNGLTALEFIKKDFPNIKVIICSGVTDKAVIDSSIALGASGYITKPFLPDAVITSLGLVGH